MAEKKDEIEKALGKNPVIFSDGPKITFKEKLAFWQQQIKTRLEVKDKSEDIKILEEISEYLSKQNTDAQEKELQELHEIITRKQLYDAYIEIQLTAQWVKILGDDRNPIQNQIMQYGGMVSTLNNCLQEIGKSLWENKDKPILLNEIFGEHENIAEYILSFCPFIVKDDKSIYHFKYETLKDHVMVAHIENSAIIKKW